MTPELENVREKNQQKLLSMLMGNWMANSVTAATELGVPECLGVTFTTSREVALAIGAGVEAIERLLRMLWALGLVESDGENSYRLSPVGELLRADHPSSMRDLALLYGEPYFHGAWAELADGVRCNEQPFRRAHGRSVFEYLKENPDLVEKYSAGIAVGSRFVDDLVRVFDFSGSHIVDVAGGDGTLMATVLDSPASATGTLLELAPALPPARRNLEAFIRAGRCRVVEGNFFEKIPHGGDIYVLCRILHNWDDIDALRILRSVRNAMPVGARLLVVERVITDTPSVITAGFDLHMFVMTSGRERSLADYRKLFRETGFVVDEMIDLPLEMKTIVARAISQ